MRTYLCLASIAGRMAAASSADRVLVVGPGAIGAFVAARVAARGTPVTVACRTSRTADEIGARGVVAEAADGARTVAEVDAVVTPEELTEEPSILLLATKCTDAAQALATWLPHVDDEVPVVGLQNGLMADTLGPMAKGRFVDSVVHFPASLLAPGHSLQTGPGGFHVGIWADGDGASGTGGHAERAAEVLRHAGPVEVTGNIAGAKWTKLIINSCITSLGVLTGTTLGDLLRDRRARDIFLRITSEGTAVGRAEGIRFETVQGFHPERFDLPPAGAGFRRFALHQALKVLGARHRRHRSSSLQSLDRGMRTEVDFLNGVIVRRGHVHGLRTPMNTAVVDQVHDIERGHLRPGMERLASLPLP